MDHAQRGANALQASDFPAAIQHYTQALATNPHATDYYIKRSTAYSRLKLADGGPNGEAALRDAELAVALGIQRARRELIITAQQRRAIALYQLERFGDAAFIFQIVRDKVGPAATPGSSNMASAMDAMNGGKSEKSAKDQELTIWEMKVKGRLGKLEEGDERAKVTVKEAPDMKVPSAEELKKLYLEQSGGESSLTSSKSNDNAAKNENKDQSVPSSQGQSKPEQANQPVPAPQVPASSKVRHEWYQNSDTVVITLYAKGVPKDKAEIDIQDNSLSITFPTATGSDYSFNLDPLYAEIDSASSRSAIMSTKIEVNLRKKQPGHKWKALEGDNTTITPANSGSIPAQDTSVPLTDNTIKKPEPKAPAYPTSSKSGAKDWDKVASSLTKKKKKPTSGEGNGDEEGDSDLSDYGGGDEVDSFFKKLYANSDPDTQRAMMKSFYESEGTALSTNWSEVGKGKVKVSPPSDDK